MPALLCHATVCTVGTRHRAWDEAEGHLGWDARSACLHCSGERMSAAAMSAVRTAHPSTPMCSARPARPGSGHSASHLQGGGGKLDAAQHGALRGMQEAHDCFLAARAPGRGVAAAAGLQFLETVHMLQGHHQARVPVAVNETEPVSAAWDTHMHTCFQCLTGRMNDAARSSHAAALDWTESNSCCSHTMH
jgi:hypothetical protein